MANEVARAVGHALALAGSMTWEILWALILGFALSAVVQAVVRRSTIVTLLGDERPRTLAIAAGLGAASSSCSYAAVALARSLFRKGANFTAAMAFEIGSTNLVVELGIILALLMGWQFTAAEFVGGPLMIVFLAVLFRLFVRSSLIDAARQQADRDRLPRHQRLDRCEVLLGQRLGRRHQRALEAVLDRSQQRVGLIAVSRRQNLAVA